MADAWPFPLTGGYGLVAWLRARARELGETAVPALEVVATDGSMELRAAALFALAEIAPARTEAFVIDRAKTDSESEVREAATRALGFASGPASLAHLRATGEDRAARIALKQRGATWTSAELVGVVIAALLEPAAEDRFASVCLDLLSERREVSGHVVLEVMRRKPAFISAGAAEGLSANIGPKQQEELLSLIAECTDEELARVFGRMASHAEPARVFDRLAPVVRAGPAVLAATIVETLSDQASAAWTSEGGHGFDDDDDPIAPMPDARWHALLTEYVRPEDGEPHYDFDLGLASLKDSLIWTYRDRARVTPGLRFIESGAEEGAAFVIAGFDLRDRQDTIALELELADLGPRSITNLHHVSHQCGGHGCSQVRLLGIPLGSKELSEQLAHDSDGVTELMEHLDTWQAANSAPLGVVREKLRRFIPRLPPLAGGLEALVWTAPTALVDALAGLPVVRILPTCHPWRPTSGFWTTLPDTLRELGPFEEAHQRLLDDLGKRLGLGQPQIYVLWANSD